jgi:hypothetical protein
MGKHGSCVYSVARLEQLWAAGKTHVEIAAALGCATAYVAELVARHNLPRRRRAYHGPQEDDPTPEQIKERAAECRARRPGPPEPKGERVSTRVFWWDGKKFDAINGF